MAIVDAFKAEKKGSSSQEESFLSDVSFVEEPVVSRTSKADFLSSICVKLLFLLLLVFNLFWFAYSFIKVSLCLALYLCFWGSPPIGVRKKLSKSWLSTKRAFICGLALLVALFSPALGIMLACTYFLMYDKSGIEEVIPSSLREQFKELFSQVESN